MGLFLETSLFVGSCDACTVVMKDVAISVLRWFEELYWLVCIILLSHEGSKKVQLFSDSLEFSALLERNGYCLKSEDSIAEMSAVIIAGNGTCQQLLSSLPLRFAFVNSFAVRIIVQRETVDQP